MAQVKGGLGRGLDALFSEQVPTGERKKEVVTSKDSVRYLPIHEITPNDNQPRKFFDPEKIDELASSILEHGLIQPIIVREKDKGYEIVAGERRFRAAIKAGLKEVPTLVRDLDDEENMLLAIIENMQREDLNPIEEAEGLNQMIENFKMTQEAVSKSVGKSRPYITNALRLLKLPEYIKDSILKGKLSQGHARALIGLDDDKQRKIFDEVIKKDLSVRETERLAKKDGKKKAPKKRAKNVDLITIEAELKEHLGTKVNIIEQGKRGKIEIEYYSKEELERLIDLLKSFK